MLGAMTGAMEFIRNSNVLAVLIRMGCFKRVATLCREAHCAVDFRKNSKVKD
jgi:hypothetical protein